jgi:hypothetical protein
MMRKRRKTLVRVVTILRQRRIIARCSYYDYLSLILTAETPDQLETIAADFAELCCFDRGRQDSRVKEKEEDTIPQRPPVLVMRDEVLPIRRHTKASGEPGVFVDLWI